MMFLFFKEHISSFVKTYLAHKSMYAMAITMAYNKYYLLLNNLAFIFLASPDQSYEQTNLDRFAELKTADPQKVHCPLLPSAYG